jgi:hypothetical protein
MERPRGAPEKMQAPRGLKVFKKIRLTLCFGRATSSLQNFHGTARPAQACSGLNTFGVQSKRSTDFFVSARAERAGYPLRCCQILTAQRHT